MFRENRTRIVFTVSALLMLAATMTIARARL